jgi:hypothetical protein
MRCGQLEEAREKLVWLDGATVEALGESHPNVQLTREILARCLMLLRDREQARRIVVAYVRLDLATPDVVNLAGEIMASEEDDPLAAGSLAAATLWHAGQPDRALAIASRTAAAARALGRGERHLADLDRLERWARAPGTDCIAVDGDPNALVRDALLRLGRAPNLSPLFEMAVLASVRDALGKGIALGPPELAASAVSGVMRAGGRLKHGWPTFAALETSAEYRRALADGCALLARETP